MAIEFVVSDGTGLADATSYISVADMKQYWENLGYALGTLTDDEIEVLLNKSTRVLDNYYIRRWPGYRNSETQRLEWPRQSAYYIDGELIDEDEIPIEVKDALCELAYISNSGTDLQPTVDPNGVAIVTDDRVSSLKTYREYYKGSIRADGRSRLTSVNDALARLFSITGMSIQRV